MILQLLDIASDYWSSQLLLQFAGDSFIRRHKKLFGRSRSEISRSAGLFGHEEDVITLGADYYIYLSLSLKHIPISNSDSYFTNLRYMRPYGIPDTHRFR
jgi:hypothetical protein